jgi:hypothetical protein|tara:strand:- start:91 stop:486 length:396 start_codon:yes stop_codon:yes gene_type:complete
MSDKLAMALSSACAIHCFFSPAFILLTSGLFSFSFDNESVHYLILLIALPVSLYALISGFMNHKTAYLLTVGVFGLFVLLLAVALGESIMGELGEKTFTLIGSFLVVYAHFKNHQACKELDCSCHDESLVN